MWKALVRAAQSTPRRDAKSYDRLVLRALAVWMIVALSVVAVAGLGLNGALLTIGLAFGLGNITARCVDHRYPPQATESEGG